MIDHDDQAEVVAALKSGKLCPHGVQCGGSEFLLTFDEGWIVIPFMALQLEMGGLQISALMVEKCVSESQVTSFIEWRMTVLPEFGEYSKSTAENALQGTDFVNQQVTL